CRNGVDGGQWLADHGRVTSTEHRPMPVPAMRPGRRTAPATARRPVAGAAAGAGRVPAVSFHGGNPLGLLGSFLTEPLLHGSQPFARSQRLPAVRDEATLRPEGTMPVRSVVSSGRNGHLVVGDGWTMLSLRWPEGGAHVEVVATSDELAKSVLEQAVDGAA